MSILSSARHSKEGFKEALSHEEKKAIVNLVTEERMEQWLSGDFDFAESLQKPYINDVLNAMLGEIGLETNMIGTFALRDSALVFFPRDLPEVELNLESEDHLEQQTQYSWVKGQSQIGITQPTVKESGREITSTEEAISLIKLIQAKANGELTDPAYDMVSCQNINFRIPKQVLVDMEKI